MEENTISITRPTQTIVASATKSETKTPTTYPTEVVDLPSQGYFYDLADPLSSGEVELKSMTAKEEDILTSENLIKKGIVLDKLLESLIVTKGVNVRNLLIGDKNALCIATRRLAYGDSYGPISMVCNSCKETNATTINLSDIKEKEFDFSEYERGKNSFMFQLPSSKRVLTFKLLDNKDELDIAAELKALQKVNKQGSSHEITTRFKYMILAIDGNTDKVAIRKFVDTDFLSRDSIAFRNKIRDVSPDLDLNFDFVCEHCGQGERRGLPMTVHFFWPES